MLKSQIASLEEVPQALREYYVKRANGGYRLETDGEANQTLMRALSAERAARKAAELRLAAGDKSSEPVWTSPECKEFVMANVNRLDGLTGEAYKAEFAKIEEEMAQLISTTVQKHWEGKLVKLTAEYVRIRTDHETTALAAKLAKRGSAEVLRPLIRDRIAVTQRDDGEWEIGYRDAAGNPVAIDALEFELRSDSALAPIIEGVSAADKEAHAKRVAETLGTMH